MESTTPEILPKKSDTYSHKGWLNSDSFIKRCFAVYGYYLVASFILSLVAFLIMGIILLTVGGSMIGMMAALSGVR